jgi:hypothetical protein
MLLYNSYTVANRGASARSMTTPLATPMATPLAHQPLKPHFLSEKKNPGMFDNIDNIQ